MSILIKGMEMPKNCALCKFRGAGETWCPFTLREVPGNTIPKDCPLIPVPPHGDLIDRDAYQYSGDLMDEPVIIPAEEVEK